MRSIILIVRSKVDVDIYTAAKLKKRLSDKEYAFIHSKLLFGLGTESIKRNKSVQISGAIKNFNKIKNNELFS